VRSVWGVDRAITAIVWHDMEGFLPGAIARWNTGVAGAHLAILRSGAVVRTCRLDDVAFHAGTDNDPKSGVFGRTQFWRQHNINPYSVGIELEGFLSKGYTPQQASACRRVSDWLTHKYSVLREHTVDQIEGHHLHSELSSSRSDPGSQFNWDWVL
jgi:N-acetyl-anhydromuramyl-L-alanine amidase AmpD